MNFLCLEQPQRSDDQQIQHSSKQDRRSVKPLKLKKSHEDLQQTTQSRFIKTTFNKNNFRERDKIQKNMSKEQVKKQRFFRNLKSTLNPIGITLNHIGMNDCLLDKDVSFRYQSSNYPISQQNHWSNISVGIQPCMYQPRSISFTYDENKRIRQSTPKFNQNTIIRKDLNLDAYNVVKNDTNLNLDQNRTQNLINTNSLPSFSQNTYSLFQPITNNFHLLSVSQIPFSQVSQIPLIQKITSPLSQKITSINPPISKQVKDEQEQFPLKSKIMTRQKAKSCISDNEIKKGFNNSLLIAQSKIQKVWGEQKASESIEASTPISIISNLINESYSPLKKERQTSSIKKRKKPIFDSSNRNTSQAQQSRPKANSQFNNSLISFGTPESMKQRNDFRISSALYEYELRTQKDDQLINHQLNKKNKSELEYIVPPHILSAWKKIREGS